MSLLDKQIQSLSEGLGASVTKLAKEVAPKSVHRLRTTIRRIESVVAYAHPDLGKKQERALETLSALRKRAGKVRDLDVQMNLLGAIANTSTARDRRALTELLKRKRAKQAERLGLAIKKLRNSNFFSHLDRIGEKAANAPGPAAPHSLPLEQASRQLSSLAAEFGLYHTVKPRLLHEMRIKLKMVRYLAELGEESAEQQRFLSEMKSVQDALGAWHDWEELAKTAENQFGERVNCPLLVEVRALFAAKYSAAKAAVGQLFSLYAAAPARKQPRPAHSPQVLAQPA